MANIFMLQNLPNLTHADLSRFAVPENEIVIRAVTSGGPGGQNVNKTATKIELRWNVRESMFFSSEEKILIESALRHRINKVGEVVIHIQSERSQLQNKETAIELLQKLVGNALKPKKKRIPTRPTRASKKRRLVGKTKLKLKKAGRRSPPVADLFGV